MKQEKAKVPKDKVSIPLKSGHIVIAKLAYI